MLCAPLALFGLFYASAVTGLAIQKRAVDFFDPAQGGGSIFDNATFGGEPLNVIISGQSSPDVLTDDGILNYAQAISFSKECLGLHLGTPQTANLGDGNGSLNQTIEFRQDFGNDFLGTCFESLLGGNHFRVWRQNGPSANSGALFLAVSKEQDASANHDLVDDGYNIGRNELVAAAVGTKSHGGVTYNTVAKNITGLMPAGSDGVNHGIAVDGVITLLTVTIQDS
ncbi:hypothetical protein DICSQDRAFT_98008 [Dichomitus squalens LYAD-421 SS1]|uniref:uncharacterized protein n=1 Tax=Dichomitus squalens (strain LYAD-421) TaxID=732165 RepID=UPI0004410C2F|nr:uncharacterized protein DICSQDRAFT_98008 [Dichomitus squalens LYAD-421 SS1]EJF66144.1 hypothetical protein DICSQDRAFT_98008 [Dichomitus squalens LYAD-421 SS1]